MTDIFTKKKRSQIMSLIRSKNTKFEETGFGILRLAEFSYRRHPKGIFGSPDAGNKTKRVAVFFDSDFWHGCKSKWWKNRPKNDFWKKKIRRNIARDKKVNKTLRGANWLVIRVSEHEIEKKPERCIRKIRKLISKRRNLHLS